MKHKMPKKETEQEVKLAVHQEQIKNLGEKVDLIMTNHLPHIQEAIDSVKKSVDGINLKLAYWSGGIVALGWVLDHLVS